jgi:hypothetical protein
MSVIVIIEVREVFDLEKEGGRCGTGFDGGTLRSGPLHGRYKGPKHPAGLKPRAGPASFKRY